MNIVKKMSMFFALLFVFMPVFSVCSFASGGIVNEYDTTDALYDLERSNVNGEAFDEAKYPFIDDGKPQLLTVNEVGYFNDVGSAGNYALYFYIYDPAVNKDISGTPMVTKPRELYTDKAEADISVSGNAADYHDFEVKLEFIDASSDGRFLKFKYSCKDAFHDIVSGCNARYYRLSDLRVTVYDNQIICEDDICIEFPGDCVYSCVDVGKEYVFTGEAKYKKVVFNEFEKIELDVQSTVYRTPTSDKGANYQNDIFTAYFAVPNSYIENYPGGLTGLKCKYQECLSNYALFMENQEAYNDASNFTNSWFPTDEYTEGAPSLIWPYSLEIEGPVLHHYGSFGVNVPKNNYSSNIYFVTEKLEDFPRNVYKVDDANNTYYHFSDEEINKINTVEQKPYQVYEYNSKDDILSVKSQFQNERWKQLFLGGFIFPVDEVDREVEPFYVLDFSEMSGYVKGGDNSDICKNLLINEADIDDFDVFCNGAEALNQTVILFRFACRDYYSADAYYEFATAEKSSSSNFIAQFSFFRYFEVIELTFERDGVGYVFPVESEPMDIVPDVTDPETPEDNFQEGVDNIVGGIKDKFNGFKSSFGSKFDGLINKIVALASGIAVLAVVVILIKLLPSRRSKDRVEIVVKTENAHSRKEKRKK